VNATAIKEFLTIVLPIVMQVLKAMRDQTTRELSQELRKAKTPEEKREAARKIADHIYKST
jgi:hypothetical protein